MSYNVCAELFETIAARLAKHAPMPKRIHDLKNEKERGKNFWTGVVGGALEAFAHQKPSSKYCRERILERATYPIRRLFFRNWITSPEIEELLEACTPRVRNKLVFELEKIGTSISALHKKYGG
jgi:hypothetical protein